MSDISYDDPQYEIKNNCRIAEEMLKAGDDNDLQTQIMDAIANLLTLAHEREISTADVVTKGAAHWLATYMEQRDPDVAYDWMNATLFPWTGERQFAEYIAGEAITLSGHEGRVNAPEWGV
jgi:hypothetical protein